MEIGMAAPLLAFALGVFFPLEAQVPVPCTVSGLDSLVTRCTGVRVRENRATADGRMLQLRVVVIPPDSGVELFEPIVPVPGGPGGGIISAGMGWARILKGARGHRSLVLVDPRLTARSGAIDCDFGDGPDHPAS